MRCGFVMSRSCHLPVPSADLALHLRSGERGERASKINIMRLSSGVEETLFLLLIASRHFGAYLPS